MAKGSTYRGSVLQARKPRANGWTKATRAIFLRHLAATCNVLASCKAAGKSSPSLYQLRARDPGFAREWEVALEEGYQRLEAELLRRAMGDAVAEDGDDDLVDPNATKEPALPFDPDLALKLLTQRRAADPQGRRKPVRLKQPNPEEVLKALERKLTAMEKRLERGR